ncbi:MAG: hypothetical protein METHAR1v1_570002 [Methanothrix sp.]|nr:MAG: hypothetical protein METHAR1v1_570002 [Methanothrix sp.]
MMEVEIMKTKGGRRIDFSMWLFEQRKREDRVGRAGSEAYQMYQTGRWPAAGTLQDRLDQMKNAGVRGAPLKALDDAWWEYIDVVTKDVAEGYLLREVGAVAERALSKAEDIEEGKRYAIERDHIEQLRRLLAKLKDI